MTAANTCWQPLSSCPVLLQDCELLKAVLSGLPVDLSGSSLWYQVSPMTSHPHHQEVCQCATPFPWYTVAFSILGPIRPLASSEDSQWPWGTRSLHPASHKVPRSSSQLVSPLLPAAPTLGSGSCPGWFCDKPSCLTLSPTKLVTHEGPVLTSTCPQIIPRPPPGSQ